MGEGGPKERIKCTIDMCENLAGFPPLRPLVIGELSGTLGWT